MFARYSLISFRRWLRRSAIVIPATTVGALVMTHAVTVSQTPQPVVDIRSGPAENQFVDDHGHLFTGPPILPKPDPGIGGAPDPKQFHDTGPYRRVNSKFGYSFVRGTIYLPCHPAQLSPDETGMIYTGGFGVGRDGAAVDAGFQYSPTYDNYALFLKIDRPAAYPTDTRRLRCNQPVAIDFGPYTAGSLTVRATGATPDQYAEASAKIDGSSRWPADGGGSSNGISIKRMTTIAQPSGWSADPSSSLFNPTWDRSGSYFGHLPTDKTPAIQWLNFQLGRARPGSPGMVSWTKWTRAMTLRVDLYPLDRSKVLCNPTGSEIEATAIDLHRGVITVSAPSCT
jgi:hypothetical protein